MGAGALAPGSVYTVFPKDKESLCRSVLSSECVRKRALSCVSSSVVFSSSERGVRGGGVSVCWSSGRRGSSLAGVCCGMPLYVSVSLARSYCVHWVVLRQHTSYDATAVCLHLSASPGRSRRPRTPVGGARRCGATGYWFSRCLTAVFVHAPILVDFAEPSLCALGSRRGCCLLQVPRVSSHQVVKPRTHSQVRPCRQRF
jgi:hypothetical protein